ncbi:MAG: hypothetical protein WC668_04320 [Patescibacteria group bacterium]|jgi:hypothetical protein
MSLRRLWLKFFSAYYGSGAGFLPRTGSKREERRAERRANRKRSN